MKAFQIFIALALCLAIAQAAIAPGKTPELSAFTSWLDNKGASSNKLAFADFVDTGLGFSAQEDISEGETLMTIPVELFVSLRNAENSDVAGALLDLKKSVGATDQLLLGIYLQSEFRNATSEFKPWLNTLPKHFTTPLYWSTEELKELEGTFLFGLVTERQKNLEDSYKSVYETFLFEKYPELFPASDFSFEGFKRSMSIVWSRSVSLRAGEEGTIALIPFLDFANHGTVKTTFKVDEETGRFVVTTESPIKKGEQVFVDAGNNNNIILLLNRGYVLEDIKYNAAIVNVQLPSEQSDIFSSAKLQVLASAGIQANSSFLLQQNVMPQMLLRTVRLQTLKPAELELYSQVMKDLPASLPSELSAIRTLTSAVARLLQRYPNSLEDDEALLKTRLSNNIRNAVLLRRGEKLTLISVVDNLQSTWVSYLIKGFPDASSVAPVAETPAAEAASE